uniref:Potassium channel domain-containing protein n=1 Tax=Plectus sambesii TaxID=2011161 RepID=A0A914VBA7_9BILA
MATKKTKTSANSLSSRCKRIVPHVVLVTAVVVYLVGGAFIFQRLELTRNRSSAINGQSDDLEFTRHRRRSAINGQSDHLEFTKNRRSTTNGESDHLLINNTNSDIERFLAFVRTNFPANLTLEIEAEMERLLFRLQISCFDVTGEGQKPTVPHDSEYESYDDLILARNNTTNSSLELFVQPIMEIVPPIVEISNEINVSTANFIQSLNSSDAINQNVSRNESVNLEEWDHLLSGILFAFTAVSTIGYGHLTPETTEGRLFCILYTMIGIPLFMITVADIGKFIWEGFWSLLLWIRRRSCCCWSSKKEHEEIAEASLFVTAPLLLIAFVGYIALGAFLLPQWEDLDWVEGCYFAFISITTVGFGDIVPGNSDFVIPTMIYIFVGLSLTTLTVEVLAAGFHRIHYVGRPIEGAKSAKLWLGSKLFTINDLVRSVGRELGVSEDQVMRLNANIDIMLEEAAEEIEQRGRIDMSPSYIRSRTPSVNKSKSSLQPEDVPLSVRVDSPRFSGQYDNIPETWGNSLDVPFADHDETRQRLLTFGSATPSPKLSSMR